MRRVPRQALDARPLVLLFGFRRQVCRHVVVVAALVVAGHVGDGQTRLGGNGKVLVIEKHHVADGTVGTGPRAFLVGRQGTGNAIGLGQKGIIQVVTVAVHFRVTKGMYLIVTITSFLVCVEIIDINFSRVETNGYHGLIWTHGNSPQSIVFPSTHRFLILDSYQESVISSVNKEILSNLDKAIGLSACFVFAVVILSVGVEGNRQGWFQCWNFFVHWFVVRHDRVNMSSPWQKQMLCLIYTLLFFVCFSKARD